MHVSIKSKMDSFPINIQLQIWKTSPEKVTFPSEVKKVQEGLDVFNNRFNSSGSKVVKDQEYMSTCHTNTPAPITKPSNTEKKPPHQELARGFCELTCDKCHSMPKISRLFKLKSIFWKDNERSLVIPGFLYRCDTCEKQNKVNQITNTTLRTFVDHQVHMKHIHSCTKGQKLIRNLFN